MEIQGKIIQVIDPMHCNPKVPLLLETTLHTRPFATNVSLKQADIVSTLFFDLYINDFLTYLTSTNNEVLLGELSKLLNSEISSVLFAYDLATLALSKQGLQDKINLLEKKCKNWGLKLNLKKTKIYFLISKKLL